jgi:hypothetical protein
MGYAYKALVEKPEMKVIMKIDLKGRGFLVMGWILLALDSVHLSACMNMT